MRKVREGMGLENVKLMVPFCRMVEEGRRVIAEMAVNGLVQGERGLEVYVMCEIPRNMTLAKEFAEVFDGFSIGSSDLTRLVLGVGLILLFNAALGLYQEQRSEADALSEALGEVNVFAAVIAGVGIQLAAASLPFAADLLGDAAIPVELWGVVFGGALLAWGLAEGRSRLAWRQHGREGSGR